MNKHFRSKNYAEASPDSGNRRLLGAIEGVLCLVPPIDPLSCLIAKDPGVLIAWLDWQNTTRGSQ